MGDLEETEGGPGEEAQEMDSLNNDYVKTDAFRQKYQFVKTALKEMEANLFALGFSMKSCNLN